MKKWKKFKIMMIGSTTLAGLLIVPTVLTSCWSGSNIVTNTPNNPSIVPPGEQPTDPPVIPPTSNPDDSETEKPPVSPPNENQPENPSEENFIKYVDYTLDPNTPEGQEENQQYWITNPNTQNKYILNRWGNAPLPMKDNISKEEAYNYFTYVAINNQIGRSYTFGERKIETDWIANVYIEWLAKNWILYPWISFENHPAYFYTDKNDSTQSFDYEILKKWEGRYPEYFEQNKFYIKKNKFSNSADFITIQSQQRDAYFEMIRLFLTNYYRPGMSDLDKTLAVFNFVMTYISYGDSNNDPYGVYMKHMGVCVHYSFTAAFLLNLIGVPSFMNLAGDLFSHPDVGRPGHAVNWVWIDADNSGKKKWYIMDATYSDYSAETTWPSAFILNDSQSWTYFLEPVSDKLGGNIDYSLKQNSFFEFLNGPWYSPFKNNDVKISPNNDYLNSMGTYQNIKSGFGNKKNSQSRPIWYNKNWYSMVIENQNQIKFYKTSMDNSQKENFDVPESVINELKGLGRLRYSTPFAGTYNDWMAFSVFEKPDYMTETPLNNKWKIFFHNFNDTEWKDTKYLEIPNEVLYTDDSGKQYKTDRAFFQTFFFDNDQICIEYSFKGTNGKTIGSVIKRYDLPDEVKIQNDKYLDSKVVENAKIYYKLIGNTHKIGVENQQITLENKKTYNDYYNNFKSTNNYYNDVMTLKKYSDDFEKSLITGTKNLASGVSSDIYLIDQNAFDEYGYYFDDINPGFDSFYNLSDDQYNTTLKYDIYFSPNANGTYELLAKDLYKPIIKKSYFKKYNEKPDGKYYIKMHNHDDSLVFQTEPFYFAIAEDNNIVSVPEQPLISYTEQLTPYTPKGQTNYFDKFIYNWYDQSYKLTLNYQWSKINSNYDVKVNLKRYDFKNKQLTTLKTWNDRLHREDYIIGKIDDNNKGIYFMDIEVKYNNKPEIYHIYSSFMYMITKKDVDSNNFNEWVNLSNDLKNTIKSEKTKS
ncbi:transglutaminase-like domain-containing protein [Malacoplasma iowae]|uniref:Transglutaminase domain-containing protein n=2 Tax=Malacoplasma iowae TaxID=2116 RepID=A0A6P1LDD3_MALIO|nr:transglutaminase-like domain-containing protein [Malacoplasma iowae]QHG89428.1 transglutaminase domain-containing protein [Malacoplasma iowae 695]WPL35851.1 transglutaminase domain-containing protein [Malacoplasma iowae]VEU62876.1 Uncharacterised protein [Mycoplasmopsis fermentans]VEU71629.1 Uncharacterised protein [Malacoplasma iowae]